MTSLMLVQPSLVEIKGIMGPRDVPETMEALPHCDCSDLSGTYDETFSSRESCVRKADCTLGSTIRE